MFGGKKNSGGWLMAGFFVAALSLPVLFIMRDLAHSISIIATKMDSIINPVPKDN